MLNFQLDILFGEVPVFKIFGLFINQVVSLLLVFFPYIFNLLSVALCCEFRETWDRL